MRGTLARRAGRAWEVEGGLYHVIARGVEHPAIFRDDTDRQNFLRRLALVAQEESLGGSFFNRRDFPAR